MTHGNRRRPIPVPLRLALLGGALLLTALARGEGLPGPVLRAVPETLATAVPVADSAAMPDDRAPPDSTVLGRVPWDFTTAPPDTVPLRPVDGIRDPVFSLLVGQALNHHVGRCDGPTLAAAVRGSGRPTRLPLQLLGGVTRVPRGAGITGVRTEFTEPLDLPVPYKILSYHPGSFRGTRVIDFDELELGHLSVTHSDVVDRAPLERTLELEDVRLYLLRSGSLAIDIDGWLDKLAGGKLDDTAVAGMVTFRWNGARYGMALGYNKKGEPRSGTLAFADDKLLYPNPPELKSVARHLRRRLEILAPEFKPSRGR